MNGAFPDLTLLTLLPVAAALILAGVENSRRNLARSIALISSALTLAHVLCLWSRFDYASGGLQFVEQHLWIKTLNVKYSLGADGLSLLMLLLTALLVPAAIASAWRVERAPLFFSLMLFLQAGLIGTFTAQNFFHWFLFWEVALIPAYFLVKLGGGVRRGAAAMQFFVYTMFGSIALLLGFLGLYLATGTFEFSELAELARNGRIIPLITVRLATGSWQALSSEGLAMVLFLGVFLGLAVKVALVPFHTWLPATYSEAPASVTMLLTGLMSKMGVYGFLRLLLPIFPEQMRASLDCLLWLAIATILVGAFAAFAQKELRRVLAYSSISHLGYCMLGIFAVASLNGEVAPGDRAAALNGVLLQMFGHGLTAGTLFFLLGFLEERMGGRCTIDQFGGLRHVAPIFAGLGGIALFSSLGLPGLNGFIAEFLIFKGVFSLEPWAAMVAAIGLLVTAAYILRVIHHVFNGQTAGGSIEFRDAGFAERIVAGPAVILMIAIGFFPQILIGIFNSTVLRLVEGLS